MKEAKKIRENIKLYETIICISAAMQEQSIEALQEEINLLGLIHFCVTGKFP